MGSLAHAAAVGEPIPESIAVHIGNPGFRTLGDVIATVVPEQLVIAASSGDLACADSDTTPLTWSIDALDVLLTVDEVAIRTDAGNIQLDVYATLSSTLSQLAVAGDCSVLTDLDEVCGLELPTTALAIAMDVDIQSTESGFDVTVGEPSLTISPLGNPLSDCTFASAVGTMLGQDPLLLTDLVTGLVEPQLAGLGPSIEGPLEDTLNSLQIGTSLDVLGTVVSVDLAPSALSLDENGLMLGLGATITPATVSDCVDSSAGSDTRNVGWPALGDTAPDSALPYDAGLFLSADFVDHALYSVWASGVFCLNAGDLLASFLPAGLTTDFLASVVGDEFEALFPEDAPATLLIHAPTPPRGGFADDGPPLHLLLDDLTVDLYAEFEHRQTRIFEVQGDADIGLDIALDESTLTTALVLDTPAVTFRESYHELIGPGFSGGLETLMGTLLGSLIPADLLPTIALPELLGAKVGSLQWLPNADESWQGGFLTLDTTNVAPVVLPGCSLDGVGCDGSGIAFELDPATLLGCATDPTAGCADSTCTTGGASLAQPSVALRAVRGRLSLLFALLVGAGILRRPRNRDTAGR